MVGQDFLDEGAVLVGDQRLQVVEVERLALADELLGHREVDAVGLAAHVLVDPRQLDLELVGTEGERSQHSVPARPAHLGDDVAAVGEGEQGELDAESVTDLGAHGVDRSENVFYLPGPPAPQGDRAAPPREM